MAHYSLINVNRTELAVLINPSAYIVRTFSGKPDPKSILACNVNYSWLGIPIGYVRSEGVNRLLTINAKKTIRPCLCINRQGLASIEVPFKEERTNDFPLILQAGPTLVWNNKIVANEASLREEFKSDAVRKTTHTTVGVTKAGKLIFACVADISIQDLGYYMHQKGCISAIKCDGGNATALWFQELKRGKANSCSLGIEFLPK